MDWRWSSRGSSTSRSGDPRGRTISSWMSPTAVRATLASDASLRYGGRVTVTEGAQVLQILSERRDATAARWHQAVARTSFVPFSSDDVRQRLAELTDRVTRALLCEPLDGGDAGAIGAALAQLRY